ncbi:MAG: hypothetical protein IT292_01240 [Deltaproteobacteria bacterium]|nr:hypothetical protein [Deltaproteobacteria bacterium]
MRPSIIPLALLAYILLLFAPIDIIGSNIVIDRLADAGHLLIFFLATILSLRIMTKHSAPSPELIKLLALGIGSLIVITELIQPYVGRSASFYDALFGLFGLALGLIDYKMYFKRIRGKYLYATILLNCLLVTLSLIPVLYATEIYLLGRKIFPVISDFESPLELKLWQPYALSSNSQPSIALSRDFKSSGRSSLAIGLPQAKFAGLEYRWQFYFERSFDKLLFDIYNPSNRFVLHLRADDKREAEFNDRYNKQFVIPPGWHTISLPLTDLTTPGGRQIDIYKLRRLLFFLDEDYLPSTFYLDNIRLE